ncbi:MAG TPA: pyridoxal phosphate-dependent aminotransferase [Bacteroidota bacterium]
MNTTKMDEIIEEVGTTVSISRRTRAMQASPIRKLASLADERKKKGIKVYHLNIGQPDLRTPEAVFQAIRDLNLPTISYAPSNGLPQALTAWKNYFSHNGIHVDEKEIIVTTGGSEAIIFALCAVCDTDDEVIVFEPFYTNYNGFASIANIRLQPVSLSIKNGFHLPNIEEIERHITPKTKAILICNPNNPTGTVYSREEIQRLVTLCQRHNLFFLSDEVYREFAYGERATSVMDFAEIRDRAVLLDSCSKRFNVCGSRIGAFVSHNTELMQAVSKLAMARLSVASIEQLSLVPLLNSPEQYTKPIVEEFHRRRDAVCAGLKTIPGVTSYTPEGAFYIVIGLPVENADHFSRWLIEEYEDNKETVLLAPANGFYASPNSGNNEVRLAFMLNIDDLKRSLEILRTALETYKKHSS